MARPRSDIQDRILAAARARFIAEGVDAASLRAIAKEAETSIGMVYYYYPTKDDLFLAVVEDCYQKFLEDLEEVLGNRQGYQARVCGFYARLGSMSDGEREIIDLVIREMFSSSDRRDRLRTRFLRGHLPLVFRVITDGFESGELDRSINPIIAMACTLGIGSVTTVVERLMRNRSNAAKNDSLLPECVRNAVCCLVPELPNNEKLAEQLSAIAVRALGKR